MIKITELKVGDRVKCNINKKIKVGHIALIGKFGISVYFEPLDYSFSEKEPLASPVNFNEIVSKLEPIQEYKEILIEQEKPVLKSIKYDIRINQFSVDTYGLNRIVTVDGIAGDFNKNFKFVGLPFLQDLEIDPSKVYTIEIKEKE